MSHFAVGIVIPKSVVESNEIEEYISEKMEKYNENNEVKPYIEYEKSKKAEYLSERIKELKGYMKKPEIYNIDAVEEELSRYNNMTPDEYWDAEYSKSWYNKDENGNIISTYNPNSKWDWYVIGGRWDGLYLDNYKSSDNGFNFDSMHHTIKNNIQTIKEYKERFNKDNDKYSMFAYINENGDWLERGNMGWWGMVNNEKDKNDYNESINKFLNEQDDNNYIINLDCHI